MLIFLVLALGLFGVAAALGWLRYASPKWVWVDMIYYPLVALGVVLFFYEAQGERAAFVLGSLETVHTALIEGVLGTVGATELSEVTEAALTESRENLAEVQARQAQIATVQGIRSVAWPAIILLALSMKFGKGVAAYRKGKALAA
ncbi:MAG: hypothetical protein AAFZ02_08845 [Pseudomonadota bacterium]